MDGRVIDGNAALGDHLFQITQAHIVGQVPAHAQQDHGLVELTAFEHCNPPKMIEGSLPQRR
ncbi:hypothetical protein GCM10010869_58830 [Mesorhizobium tianshanense]|nr:hypothetical protein GCM10010869_58830 [Mesorhizobium tianshanense]